MQNLNNPNLKKILFVTTSSLATNPRLIKEMETLLSMADITCLAFSIGGWSNEVDEKIKRTLPRIRFIQLSAGRTPFYNWLKSTLIALFCQTVWPFFKQNLWISAYASFKRSWLLKKTLQQLKTERFDLVVGHNLGALYPVYLHSVKTRTPFAFDVEDYHPGERIDQDFQNERRRRSFLMKQLLPKAHYVTYASPLIKKTTLELYKRNGQAKQKNQIVITNAFPKKEFQLYAPEHNNKVTFVWFSQNISANRGLEMILPTLHHYANQIKVLLIGKLDVSFFESFLKPYQHFLEIMPPVNQKDLHQLVSKCDVGLALELNKSDFNRQICLTNKIYAYAQAGLYILATDTPAQTQFINQNKGFGITVNQTVPDIERAILSILKEIQSIRQEKAKRFEAAKKIAWEIEAKKLCQLVQHL